MDDGRGAGEPGTGGGAAGGETPIGTPPPAGFAPQAATLRRLTRAQYENTVRDLLGDGLTLSVELEPDTVLHGFSSIGASRVALSARATELFETAAHALAAQVFASEPLRQALVDCDPVAEPECTTQFIEGFGRRAFRRPLAADEVTRYVAVAGTAAQTLGSAWDGLQYALAGLLQSPHFLYRVELGTADAKDPSRQVFDGYELASRLSYFLWNTTPDLELLDAAARGDLSSEAGLLAQTERLLGAPRAQAAFDTFFRELYRLDGLDDLAQLPSAFPQVTATLGPALREETLRFFADLVEQDGSYRSIFEARGTFVNAEVAALYELSAPAGAGFAAISLPANGARVGILGHGSFLATNAHASSTSPTLRGKFIREVLLCQAIPPPPPDVVTDLAATVGDEPRTMRQKLAVHSEQPACAACHRVMDPIGLGLENFDGIGAHRLTDAGQVIDASGEIDGVAFQNAAGLAAALGRHPAVSECLARNVYRYAIGHLESSSEDPLVVALGRQSEAEGSRLRALFSSVVASAAFRYAGSVK
jgi:hypothetical protein